MTPIPSARFRLSIDSVHDVRLRPSGWVFGVAPGESILEAARRAGIRMPSSCRNGTCRACLCRMVSGAVDYRVEWPGVSRDERDEGWLLACVARPRMPLVLDAPRAARLADEAPRAPLPLTGARR
ncbi:2Fe-2S iron-sulfur cluster binding domain-containing protein [Verticiella sediminum]|uniref:2Fe-2S iron-sulfur cluster binding domain-containing protein n=1 Tax=Verticiella sediminum TaxID=1247510 RepID=A0A556AD23_9BURK|nr:2Fe-2S iron-sulfur cluster binding domain-containing protein [Verticiella sediminum]